MWHELLHVWKVWHLNDMQAGCEHQAGWDISKELKFYNWHLNNYTRDRQEKLKAEAVERAASTESAALGFEAEDKRILRLEWSIITIDPELTGYNQKYYEAYNGSLGRHVKTKAAGWVYPTGSGHDQEHPEGLLCKPCEVCGYEYGTKWLKKELPPEIVTFIESLPETTKQPAWV